MNAHAAEDPTVREARLRRRNRNTLVWVGAFLTALAVAGYFWGGYLLKNPPPANFH